MLLKLYAFFDKHHLLMAFSLVAIVLVLVLCVLKINFVEDISNFLPQEGRNNRENYAYQNIGAANKIMINVASLGQKQRRRTHASSFTS